MHQSLNHDTREFRRNSFTSRLSYRKFFIEINFHRRIIVQQNFEMGAIISFFTFLFKKKLIEIEPAVEYEGAIEDEETEIPNKNEEEDRALKRGE